MQRRVYQTQIRSVDELKRRLIDVCCSGLEQSIFDEATDQWRKRLRARDRAKGGYLKYSSWTDKVDFVHMCYTECDLFHRSIFNYEIIPAQRQRWPTHAWMFTLYKVVR